jgi:hypothetical protein
MTEETTPSEGAATRPRRANILLATIRRETIRLRATILRRNGTIHHPKGANRRREMIRHSVRIRRRARIRLLPSNESGMVRKEKKRLSFDSLFLTYLGA